MGAPPPGWHLGDFWGDLVVVVGAQKGAIAAASVFLALLVVGRALLPAVDRKRLRMPFAMFTLYFLLLPVKAVLLSRGLESTYTTVQLTATVALVWGMVGIGSLLLFDLLARRLAVPKIIRDITTIILSLVGLVTVLSKSGVNLLSLITTSAVLTAVIGLALQDTLGSLMSGIALQLESSISIGDWIRVDDKVIGKVLEIRWRSTMIRTKDDDIVIIPNGMLTKGMVTNFAKDGLENRRFVFFNVHLRHPPNVVQQVVKDSLVGTFNVSTRTPPNCVVWKYHESWLEYAVLYRLIDYLPDFTTDSEVRKRIWYGLRRHGIEIPYPGHNLFVTELTAAREQQKSEKEQRRRLDAIDKVSFFTPLSAEERAHLATGLRFAVYGHEEVVIRAGEVGESMYVIRDGKVSVRIGVNGLEKEVAVLVPGQFFGEMSLMTGEPRRATVAAKGDVECYVLDRSLFGEIVQKNPSVVSDIGKLFADRELNLKGQREGLLVESARARAEQQALLGRIKSFFGL
jgi:small-conductance mechanosensitive channel